MTLSHQELTRASTTAGVVAELPESSSTVLYPLQVGCRLALWEGQRTTTWDRQKMVALVRDLQKHSKTGSVMELGYVILTEPRSFLNPYCFVDAQQRTTTLLLTGFAMLRLALESKVVVSPESLAPLFHVDTLDFLRGREVDTRSGLEGRYGYLRDGRLQPRLDFTVDGDSARNEAFHLMLTGELKDLNPYLTRTDGLDKLAGGFLAIREHLADTLKTDRDFAELAQFLGERLRVRQQVLPEMLAAAAFVQANDGEPIKYYESLRVLIFIAEVFMPTARKLEQFQHHKITPFFNSGRDANFADSLTRSLVNSYGIDPTYVRKAGELLAKHYADNAGTQVDDWKRFVELARSFTEQSTLRQKVAANFLYKVGVQANNATALSWLARVDRLLGDCDDERFMLVVNELITFIYAMLLKRNWRQCSRELDELLLHDRRFATVVSAEGTTDSVLMELRKLLKGLDGVLHWPTKRELGWLAEHVLRPATLDVFDQTIGGMFHHMDCQSSIALGKLPLELNAGKKKFNTFKKGAQMLFQSSELLTGGESKRDLGVLNFVRAAGTTRKRTVVERLKLKRTTAEGKSVELYNATTQAIAHKLRSLWAEHDELQSVVTLNSESEPLSSEEQKAADAVAKAQRTYVGKLLADFYGADDSTGTVEANDFRELYEVAEQHFAPADHELLFLYWPQVGSDPVQLTKSGALCDGEPVGTMGELFVDGRVPQLESAMVLYVRKAGSTSELAEVLLAKAR